MIESMFDLIDQKADAYEKVTEKNLESFLHGFDLYSVIEPCAEEINNKICRNMLRNMADNGGTGVSLEFPGCLELLIDEAVSKAIEEYLDHFRNILMQ